MRCNHICMLCFVLFLKLMFTLVSKDLFSKGLQSTGSLILNDFHSSKIKYCRSITWHTTTGLVLNLPGRFYQWMLTNVLKTTGLERWRERERECQWKQCCCLLPVETGIKGSKNSGGRCYKESHLHMKQRRSQRKTETESMSKNKNVSTWIPLKAQDPCFFALVALKAVYFTSITK